MNDLLIIKPLGDVPHIRGRMTAMLRDVLDELREEHNPAMGEVLQIRRIDELNGIDLQGRRILFAVCLSEAGINTEYYKLLEFFRRYPHCLDGAVGGIIVDGAGELYTKAVGRRLAFSANMSGCTFLGKPLVEATGSLGNFHVLSKVYGMEPLDVYHKMVHDLIIKLLSFELPAVGTLTGTSVESKAEQKMHGNVPGDVFSNAGGNNRHRPKILAVHASSSKTSNTLLLWHMIRDDIGDRASVKEISLRNGSVVDCRGCNYEACLHFGEKDSCFYGGIMTDEVYPAVVDCDELMIICPNYNDAVSANITAFINRLTALFRTHDFSRKKVYAIVVSGYSGGDIVSEQIIGAINFNKNFILPARFALVETANDPKSILKVNGIEEKAAAFAERMLQ